MTISIWKFFALCVALFFTVMFVPNCVLAIGQAMEPAKISTGITYLSELLEQYPDEPAAREMAATIQLNLENGRYDQVSAEELAGLLTMDLRSIRHDFHLGVQFTPTEPTEDSAHHLDNPEVVNTLRRDNFGFTEARIFDGNIGYLRISAFQDISVAGRSAHHALGFVANSDALIIDIRGNLGGEPNMVRLLQSAFFSEPVHMNTIHYTDGREDSVEEIWTDPSLFNTSALHHTPLYILTSRLVASAAEDFAYSLQAQGRAVIVGSTTLGAAHPGESHYRSDLKLSFGMPHGYVENPVTGTDWEGTGVKPDIEAVDGETIDAALTLARQKLAIVEVEL